MKELLQKIENLEKTIVEVVGLLHSVKKQNTILTDENQRLTYTINQLSKDRGENPAEIAGSESSEKEVLSDRTINIELIREELDSCISELSTYIEANSTDA